MATRRSLRTFLPRICVYLIKSVQYLEYRQVDILAGADNEAGTRLTCILRGKWIEIVHSVTENNGLKLSPGDLRVQPPCCFTALSIACRQNLSVMIYRFVTFYFSFASHLAPRSCYSSYWKYFRLYRLVILDKRFFTILFSSFFSE